MLACWMHLRKSLILRGALAITHAECALCCHATPWSPGIPTHLMQRTGELVVSSWSAKIAQAQRLPLLGQEFMAPWANYTHCPATPTSIWEANARTFSKTSRPGLQSLHHTRSKTRID